MRDASDQCVVTVWCDKNLEMADARHVRMHVRCMQCVLCGNWYAETDDVCTFRFYLSVFSFFDSHLFVAHSGLCII